MASGGDEGAGPSGTAHRSVDNRLAASDHREPRVSGHTAALIALLGPKGISLPQILMICIPATLLGVIIASLIQMRIGVELDQDPEYLFCILKKSQTLQHPKHR